MRRLALLALILCAPRAASAGRTFYGWLYGTETLPERGVEAASWISEENHVDGQNGSSTTEWWVAPLVGINDQLELALPIAMQWSVDDSGVKHNALDRYGAELRYRFVTTDPVDAPALVPLLRIGVARKVTDRDLTIPELDLVVSYQEGIVHFLADLGGYAEISTCNAPLTDPMPCNKTHFEVHPGAGVSIAALGDLRFGAEIHAEISLDDAASTWAVVGPNFAWSHGRFWISGAYGIGIYGIRNAPKVQWGIAF